MVELARTLLSRGPAAGDTLAPALDQLRQILIRFAGLEGFQAIFRRSLRLCLEDAPGVGAVSLQADGSLKGLELIGTDEAVALMSCQLEILSSLIGERLMLRLLADAWPELLK